MRRGNFSKPSKPSVEAYSRLKRYLSRLGRVVVAFSGGVDSGLVAKAAEDVAEDAVAVTFDSVFLQRSALEEAKALADWIGISHEVLSWEPLSFSQIVKNDEFRCYYCKLEMGKLLQSFAEALGAEVVDGTNFSDLASSRPGLKALRELGIRSPLAELSIGKGFVREIASWLDMPNANKPSQSCLATRIMTGTLTEERLRRVERCEEFLRGLGFRDFRLRDFWDFAALEVAEEEIEKALRLRREIERLRGFGFQRVLLDLEPRVS